MMNRKLNTDMAALFVAFVALAMAGLDGYEQRQHNRKSVMPVLVPEIRQDHSEALRSVEYALRNSGMGPAAIKEFRVFFNGKEEASFSVPGYSTHYYKSISAAQHKVTTLNEENEKQWLFDVSDQGLGSTSYIQANQRLSLLKIGTNIPRQEFREMFSALNETLDVFICYCSIYDDHCQWAHLGQHKELVVQRCNIE